MPLKSSGPLKITDEDLRRVVLSNMQARALFQDNEELFAEVVRSEITKQDVVAVGYRKRQLQVFQKLLEDPQYFEDAKTRKQCSSEAVWQKYFEKNPWIFGYGLSYIQLSGLDEKKLEQVVHGHTVAEHGKRVDALLRTRGVISSLCFVEIKTHKTALLQNQPYRQGCWAASPELSGGVSQVQGTVSLATETIRTKLSLTDEGGNPTGEETFNYAPKSFLVVGSLREFVGDHGVNQERYRSFELFRRNTASPESSRSMNFMNAPNSSSISMKPDSVLVLTGRQRRVSSIDVLARGTNRHSASNDRRRCPRDSRGFSAGGVGVRSFSPSSPGNRHKFRYWEAVARELLRRNWRVVGASRRTAAIADPRYTHLRIDLGNVAE